MYSYRKGVMNTGTENENIQENFTILDPNMSETTRYIIYIIMAVMIMLFLWLLWKQYGNKLSSNGFSMFY